MLRFISNISAFSIKNLSFTRSSRNKTSIRLGPAAPMIKPERNLLLQRRQLKRCSICCSVLPLRGDTRLLHLKEPVYSAARFSAGWNPAWVSCWSVSCLDSSWFWSMMGRSAEQLRWDAGETPVPPECWDQVLFWKPKKFNDVILFQLVYLIKYEISDYGFKVWFEWLNMFQNVLIVNGGQG